MLMAFNRGVLKREQCLMWDPICRGEIPVRQQTKLGEAARV